MYKVIKANENLGPDMKDADYAGPEWDNECIGENILCYPGYEDTGETPLVAFHGNTGNADNWSEIYNGLRDRGWEGPLLARNTESTSPTIEEYTQDIVETIDKVKQQYNVEEVDIMVHSLAVPTSVKAIHENDKYDDVRKGFLIAGDLKGSNLADWGRRTSMFAYKPLSPEFVTRKSGIDGELAELREENQLTDEVEVYGMQAEKDIFYQSIEESWSQNNPFLKMFPFTTGISCDMFRTFWRLPKNDSSSTVINGAKENREFEGTSHKDLVTDGDDEVVEYILSALEE